MAMTNEKVQSKTKSQQLSSHSAQMTFDETADIIIAPALATTHNKRIKIRLANITEFPYTKKANPIIGTSNPQAGRNETNSCANTTRRPRRFTHVRQRTFERLRSRPK